MATMQIRNVPPNVAAQAKARAAEAGKTLSDYLLQLVSEEVSRPSLAEMRRVLGQFPPATVNANAAELIREDRDSH